MSETLDQNLGEFEVDVLACQLLVDSAERVHFVLDLYNKTMMIVNLCVITIDQSIKIII